MALRHRLLSRQVREIPGLTGRGKTKVRMRRPVSYGPHVPQLIRLVRTPFGLSPGRRTTLDLGERGVEERPVPAVPSPPFERRRTTDDSGRTPAIDASLGEFP